MLGRSPRSSRPRRSPSQKSSKPRNRVLRSELLEPRNLLSGGGFLNLAFGGLFLASPDSIRVAINAPPTLAQSINVNGNATVTGKIASVSVLGKDDGGESALRYTWSVTAAPSGATATFNVNGTNLAKNATVTFTKAGTYNLSVKIVDAGGLSVTSSKTVVVSSTLATVSVRTPTGQLLSPTSALNVPGVSQAFAAQGLDQFGNLLSAQIGFTWSISTLPQNAPRPSIAANGAAATVTFGQAGTYALAVQAKAAGGVSVTSTLPIYVNQSLTSIVVSPNTAGVLQGATQQFTPQALDQFHQSMVNQQIFTWSASAGAISSSGLFTAPSTGTSCTVTAKSGTVSGVATVTILANSGNFGNAALAQLVQSLDADGSISRADMIQILRSVGADGVVDAIDFSDLKKVLNQSATLNIPDYVKILAGDVVNGNLANATFQGQTLGNLAAGSSATQLNQLIGKWFLGTDHPTLCNTSVSYRSVAGSLFPHTPSHADERQGQLGDCYFISALGTLADSNPAAVQNMFINNGDGTYTVRFYTGTYGTIYNYSNGSISAGFNNNVGTADYVTVDGLLPTSSSGILAYADYGASYSNTANSLWIPLAEKAYAQWNQTGKEGRDGQNAYASIQGGWMATVDAQVLGYNATDYIMTNTGKQVAINALASKQAVTIGTLTWSTDTKDGLYASHAYAIIGYSATTDTFTLYNPWGSNQPGQLTWAQLQADCSQLAVADTSGTKPISGVPVKLASIAMPFSSNFSNLAPCAVVNSASPNLAVAPRAESGPAPSSVPARHSSVAAITSRELLDALQSIPARNAPDTNVADLQQDALSARLVDATFAADGLAWQVECDLQT